MFLPQRLKKARQKAGLSQEKFLVRLANSGLSLSRNALFSWETGRTQPNVNELLLLAKCLDRPLGYFFNQSTLQNGMVCRKGDLATVRGS